MRLPRVRFTVRRLMVIMAVVAAILTAWVEVDQYKWRRHLNTEMTWGRSSVGHFFLDPKYHTFIGPRRPAACLLKVSELGRLDQRGNYFQIRASLDREGKLFSEIYDSTGGGQGQRILSVAELAQVQQIISKLPTADRASSQGELFLVGSLDKGSWVTQVYDKAALPPAVQDLLEIIQSNDTN